MGNYRPILDGFARQSLIKAPNIPDFHLMIGTAECLESLPVLIYANTYVPNEVVENMQKVSTLEENNMSVAEAIQNNVLEVNDLNYNVALLGIGGL